ncbi:MAG: hypothetical protein COX57_11350 [Alphaproteobacteria bacterium CG_4_10_14_0_2_um_filter_63_37]|nr:MAG: hypothetical protein AUJ55_03010 [Proteobacteria bacterium CG1_02_64_396]PJA23894.1 MAG: hypothetical protein COX57_11350 [Alphaproteobacteria bacterium CG_4_10_14_0_2_um_filter_63_37]
MNKQDRFERDLLKARSFMNERRFREAHELLHPWLGSFPESPDLLLGLGIASGEVGATAEAKALLERCHKLRPDWAEPLVHLGIARFQSGDHEGAMAAWAQAEQRGSRNPDLHYHLGIAFSGQGWWDKALAAFDTAIACHPGHFPARLNRAWVLAQGARFAEARQALEELLEEIGDQADLLRTLAMVATEQEDFAAAATALDRLLKLDPDRLDAWSNRAYIALKMDQPQVALPAIERVLARLPQDPAALINRACWERDYGDAAKVAAILDPLLGQQLPPYVVAAVSALLGNETQLRAALEAAQHEGGEAVLRAVKRDLPFKGWLARLGLL